MKNILTVTKDEVVKAYSGKPGCMCGCKGKYAYNPVHRALGGVNRGYAVEDDEVNIRQVSRVLKVLKNLAILGREVDYGDNYAYAEINGRAYAVYSA